jgi:hypothetical protein
MFFAVADKAKLAKLLTVERGRVMKLEGVGRRDRRAATITKVAMAAAVVDQDEIYRQVVQAATHQTKAPVGYLVGDQFKDRARILALLTDVAEALAEKGVGVDLAPLSESNAKRLSQDTYGALGNWIFSRIVSAIDRRPFPMTELTDHAAAAPSAKIDRFTMDQRVIDTARKSATNATLGNNVNPPFVDGRAVRELLLDVQQRIATTDGVMVELGRGASKDYDDLSQGTYAKVSNWAYKRQTA